MRFLPATRKVKCPDGSVHYIFRDHSKAFPLALREMSNKLSAAADILGNVEGKVGAEYRTAYTALLIRLDETSSAMQSEFNAVYQAFASSPCTRPGYLQDEVSEVIRRRSQYQDILIHVRVLEKLIDTGSPAEVILEALGSIIRKADFQQPALSATLQDAKELVSKWGKANGERS